MIYDLVELVSFSRVAITWLTVCFALGLAILFHGKGLGRCMLISLVVSILAVGAIRLLPFVLNPALVDELGWLSSSHPYVVRAMVKSWFFEATVPTVMTAFFFGIFSAGKTILRKIKA